jgi:PKD repeat protein
MTTGRRTCVSLLSVLLCVPALAAEAATIYVPDGGDLQAALNDAQPGDTILLAQGAEFVGNFVLPAKTGDGWITLRSSTPDAVLPLPGVRILPEYATLFARLRSPTLDTAALRTAPGAHHWEIKFLEFAGNPMGAGDLIQLGDGSVAQDSLDKVPHHLVLRHVYVHGDPKVGQKRCIALNAADVVIADSYVSDCKSTTQDSQAIGGWNGPGPFLIENNYLEGAGENIMFGGADPAIKGLVPSNIIVRRNLISRPMAWRDPIIPAPENVSATVEAGGSLPPGSYAYRVVARRLVGNNTTGVSAGSVEVTATTTDAGSAVRLKWDPVPDAAEYRVYGRVSGLQTTYWKVTTPEFLDTGAAGTSGQIGSPTSWLVKNLFELKNASDVTVEENIFENHWKDGQPGWAIVLTPRNSNGSCDWCVVEHVMFRYNVVTNVAAGINILGYDSPGVSRQTNNIDIENNLFLMASLGGNGWFLQMGDQPTDVRVKHNTIDSYGSTVVYVYGGSCSVPKPVYGFQFIGNAARFGNYGINSPCGTGNPTLNAYFPGGVFMWNCLAGHPVTRYPPPPAFIPCAPFESNFVDIANGDYTVREGSPLKRAATCTNPETLETFPCDIGVDFAGLIAQLQVNDARNRELLLPPPTRPTAEINVTCTYLDCAFADQSTDGSGPIAERLWTFGDGTFGTDASGTHTFPGKGTYTILLTVRDAIGLEDSDRVTVSVRPPNVKPTAAFDFACVDLACTFTDRSTDSDGSVSSWSWSFGSAGSSTEPSPSFTFPVPGPYDVSLTVTDNEGATSMTAVAVDIRAVIHAALVASTTTGDGKGSWKVSATLGIHGPRPDERGIAGATILVTWTGQKTVSCVTNAEGLCTFDTGPLGGSRDSATLTVLSVSAPLSVYQWPTNHDAAGNPSGKAWTFLRP